MRRLLIVLLAVSLAGMAAVAATVNVMHGWPGEQAPAFEKIVEAFEAENPDIDVIVEIVGRDRPAILATRLAAGNPPDLTPHPWVGTMRQWADAGEIVDLTGLVDTSDINPALIPIGEYNDGLYGLFIFPNVKSLVWYNPKQFDAMGYEIPNTWYELQALSDQILTDGISVARPVPVNRELTIDIPVGPSDQAAIVRYPVYEGDERVMEVINEVQFDPGNPEALRAFLINFDVHNRWRTMFDDFHLYLIGNINRGCIWGTYDFGPWGAASVTNGTPYGPGVTISWAGTAVGFCTWMHFGVIVDPACGPFIARAFWTSGGDPGPEIPFPWQRWIPGVGVVRDVIPET